MKHLITTLFLIIALQGYSQSQSYYGNSITGNIGISAPLNKSFSVGITGTFDHTLNDWTHKPSDNYECLISLVYGKKSNHYFSYYIGEGITYHPYYSPITDEFRNVIGGFKQVPVLFGILGFNYNLKMFGKCYLSGGLSVKTRQYKMELVINDKWITSTVDQLYFVPSLNLGLNIIL